MAIPVWIHRHLMKEGIQWLKREEEKLGYFALRLSEREDVEGSKRKWRQFQRRLDQRRDLEKALHRI